MWRFSLLLLLLLGAEALLFQAVFVPSVRILNKACSEVDQLVVGGAAPILRDALSCSDFHNKNQHSVFVNTAPPNYFPTESLPSTLQISIKDTKGRYYHEIIELSNEDRLKEHKLHLKSENGSIIEAAVLVQQVSFATEERSFLEGLLRSSASGAAIAVSMASVYFFFLAVRERFQRRRYLDDIRSPRIAEQTRWVPESGSERLLSDEEDVLYERPKAVEPLIEFE
uniref:Transmembrane protein n=1 Tax=Steinernema glaseri TaxID=37863 RepID=A0A1I7Z0C3_9BILA